MIPIQYPLIRGVRHGFSSIELNFGPIRFTGFKSLNYSRTRTRGLVRGNHPDPLGKTRGENEYKADLEIYLAEWNLVQAEIQGLARAKGLAYGDLQFTLNAIYGENAFDTIQDTIYGCSIDTLDVSQSQGSDPLVRKIELNPLKILFNGIDDVSVPLQTLASALSAPSALAA